MLLEVRADQLIPHMNNIVEVVFNRLWLNFDCIYYKSTIIMSLLFDFKPQFLRPFWSIFFTLDLCESKCLS